MQVFFIGLFLVLLAISPSVVQSFAESIISVEFDKLSYNTRESLTIFGNVSELSMPVIVMRIFDPDENIIFAGSVNINTSGNFSKTIQLDPPFYEKIGDYKIQFDYRKISHQEFFSISKDNLGSEEIFEEEKHSIKPEITLLITNKIGYIDNDQITISGMVSFIDEPTVLVGIYDTFGGPAGFYFGNINPDLEFSVNFLAKAGINFKQNGEYSAKAFYGESEEKIFFNFYKGTQNTDEIISEPDFIDTSVYDETFEVDFTDTTIPDEIISEPDFIDFQEANNSNNLSVEDIELGKLLNQINLKCDTRKYIDTISYYDGMGPALYRLCNFDSALSLFNDSLVQDPTNVEILTNKGSTLAKLGYFSEAILYYDQAINIDPVFLPAKNNKANANANLGNFNEAISLYYEILAENPDYITARKNLEIALSETPQIPTLIEEYETKNTVHSKSSQSEKTIAFESKKQKSTNFFEELSLAFSSLGSLFGFWTKFFTFNHT